MNLGIALTATLLLGLFYSWTSRMNAIFFFGRSISPGLMGSGEAQAITRRYRFSVIVATILAAAVSCMGSVWGTHFMMVGPLLLAVSFWFIFARANRDARALQATEPPASRAVVQVDLAQAPTYWIPGWITVLLPVALAVLIFTGGTFYAGHGQGLKAGWDVLINRTDSDYLAGVLGMSLGMFTSASILLCLLKTSVRLRTRMAQYSLRASVVLQWVSLSLLLAVLVMANAGTRLPHDFGKGVMMAGVLIAVAIVAWNQKRAAQFVPPAAELGLDDRWRWGLFYADKQDPALFVQSRCGTGFTLNYGRMVAWPIALVLAAYFLSMLFLFPQHK